MVRTAEAYAACEQIAEAHYENFPVASRLLPRAMRPHVAAIYAFARVADDFADEGERTDVERQRLLDDWLARLHACADPGAPASVPGTHASGPDNVFLALGQTIRVCRLPVTLFEDLIDAFRQDITTHRYATWAEVLDYCRRSANPVGRLILRLAGYHDPALDEASDSLCTALQLTNFLQDLDRDYQHGRLYVPTKDLSTYGADEGDLSARRLTPAWCRLVRELAARTQALFERGRPVCDGVGGRLAYQLRFTWLGGCRILERLEDVGFDVFNHRPVLGSADLPVLLWRAARWRRRPAC
jgi:squalene synthase HpnC